MSVVSAKSGQSLLETLLAIGVILTVTIAASTLIVSTVAAGQSSTDKVAAANFAREGIEIVRGIRDSNWLKRSQNVTNTITGAIYAWDDNPYYQSASGGEDPKFKSLGSASPGNTFIAKYDPVNGWKLISSIYNGTSWSLISTVLDTPINQLDPVNSPYLSQLDVPCTTPCVPTKYSRTIVITKTNDTFFNTNDATYLNVVSTITWQNHGQKTLTVSEKMYDWK